MGGLKKGELKKRGEKRNGKGEGIGRYTRDERRREKKREQSSRKMADSEGETRMEEKSKLATDNRAKFENVLREGHGRLRGRGKINADRSGK